MTPSTQTPINQDRWKSPARFPPDDPRVEEPFRAGFYACEQKSGSAPTASRSSRDLHTPSSICLVSKRFPRSSQYHPEWVMANATREANTLWMTEWLTTALELRPGMRVLDLGCGRAASSIFLRREFGVQVWAIDSWFSASENIQRIRDAGVEDGVFPIHADARSFPFAEGFFDAIMCTDSSFHYGNDDRYLKYLAQCVKPGGSVGIAGVGLVQEFDGSVPDHLQEWWTQDLWCLHSAPCWRRHWEQTRIMDIELADTMPDGWQVWLDWQMTASPNNRAKIKALEADRGRYLGYVRLVGRRQGQAKLEDLVVSVPVQYTKKLLLRSEER
jgi:cyclopropane fatty-acyl-phospholipid synthase-like methyltransferase